MSSASFILTVRVKLKSGEVLSFVGDSGYGEGNETYCHLIAGASPAELGSCGSIAELKEKLRVSVQEDQELVGRLLKGRTVLMEHEPLMKSLDKVSSMDDIEAVTINGDQYSREGKRRYRHYTYYRDDRLMVYDIGGSEEVDDGTGGRLAFWIDEKQAVRGKDFGKGGRKDAYHPSYEKAMSYDAEVVPDEGELRKRLDEREEMRRQSRERLSRREELLENEIRNRRGLTSDFSGEVIGCDWYDAYIPEIAGAVKRNGFRLAPLWRTSEADADAFIESCDAFVIADMPERILQAVKADDGHLPADLGENLIRLEALARHLKKGNGICILSEADMIRYADDPVHGQKAFLRKMSKVDKKQLEAALDMAEEDYSLSREESAVLFRNPEGLVYRTTLLDCTCPAYARDSERNGVCKHMIALAMILGWKPGLPAEQVGPVCSGVVPEDGTEVLKRKVREQKERFGAYIRRAAADSGEPGPNEQEIPAGYRELFDRDEKVVIPSRHFTLAGIGEQYVWAKKWIEEKGGSVHEGVVQKDHYLVVCLEAEPENRDAYLEEITGMIGQVLANREKKAKTKIVTDHQLFGGERY